MILMRTINYLSMLLFILMIASNTFAEQATGPNQYLVQIKGDSRSSEQFVTTLVLVVKDQPVHTQDEGSYSPIVLSVAGTPMYASFQSPLEIQWDFGDGSGVVIIKD